MLLAQGCVGSHIVEVAKEGGKGDVGCIVEPGIAEYKDAVL